MDAQDLEELDNVIINRTEDPDKVLEKLEAAAAQGEFDEVRPSKRPTKVATEENPTEEQSPQVDTTQPEPIGEKTQEVPTEVTTEPAASPKGKVIINDNFIALQKDPELRSILSEVKGEEMSPKMLKMFVNEQSFIRKTKAEQQKRSLDANLPTPKVPQSPITNPDAVNTLVLANMRSKYPDLPKDVASFNEYLKDLQFTDPMKLQDLYSDYRDTRNQVTTYIQKYEDLKQNWESVAEQTINEDVSKFEEELATMGLTSKDLGLDLKLNQTSPQGAAKYNEYLYKNVLFDENGKANPNVVGFMADVPVIQKGTVYETLMRKNLPAILSKVKSGAPAQAPVARPAGVRPKPTPPPSLASAKGGSSSTPQMSKVKTMDEIIDPTGHASVKDVDQVLDDIVREYMS